MARRVRLPAATAAVIAGRGGLGDGRRRFAENGSAAGHHPATASGNRGGLPNLLSMAGLGLGFAALGAVLGGGMKDAVRLLELALLADGFAGMAAQRLGGGTELGAELDSLSALICFGIAAPVVAFEVSLGQPGQGGVVLACAFAVVAALRLSRDNAERPDWPRYQGLPLPAAGLALALASDLGLSARGVTAILILGALLMLAPIKYPRLPQRLPVAAPFGLALGFHALGLQSAGWALAAILVAYALLGPFFKGSERLQNA